MTTRPLITAPAPIISGGAPGVVGSTDLSIVIVSWNTRDITRACLRSVRERLGSLSAEVFLVDNASTDGSPEMVAAEFPEVRLIGNAENRGFAAANNQALAVARGRHLLLLNSDTVVLGDVLTRSVAYMDGHREVGVFGCRVLNPDRTMQRTCFQYPSLLNAVLKSTGLFHLPWPRFLGREHMAHWQRDTERDVDVVTGCYMLVRREAVERVGLLDESFFFNYEETDWCRRFKRAGWAVRFAPVGEIIHIGNASGRKLNHVRDLLLMEGKIRLHRKHGGVASAALVWLLCALFVLGRVAAWGCAVAIGRRGAAHERLAHFTRVLGRLHTVWPRRAGRGGSWVKRAT